MITAVDTNVLADLRCGDAEFEGLAIRTLAQARQRGAMVICEVVRAELAVGFETAAALDFFLESLGIETQALGAEACWRAACAWAEYRRRGAGGCESCQIS